MNILLSSMHFKFSIYLIWNWQNPKSKMNFFLLQIYLGRGSNKKKKKVGNFPYPRAPPRPPPSKVGNLFMIFFQHPRVKFSLFIDAIHDIWNQGKRGTRVFILNIFQRIVGYLRVICTFESTQKSRIRKHR